MCEEKQLSEEGAELALANAYQLQSFAHRYLASKAASHDEDERERLQGLAEEMFDLAEKEFETGFGAESVHVARFSENPEPYKLVIGSLLDVTGNYVRTDLVWTICRIFELDPEQLRANYRVWQSKRKDEDDAHDVSSH